MKPFTPVSPKDWTFQKLFSKIFVYNILFEDAEVDETFLGVGPESTVLCISGAGCGVAGHLSKHPISVDTVDINRHHLALTALKVAAAQNIKDYWNFYEIFGTGRLQDPAKTIRSVTDGMPGWIQEYWSHHYNRFRKNIYQTGLTARMLGIVRRYTGIDANWILERQQEPIDVRIEKVENEIIRVFDNAVARRMFTSPLQLLALGVNFQQRDRILESSGMDIFTFFGEHLKSLATTDLESNWIVWWALAGQFNHAKQEAVPPYLRQDRHERSSQSPTRVRYHNANIFNVLGSANKNTWSHFTLCDAIDWMSEPIQRRLLEEIIRTGRDGGVVLYRSVEPHSIIERLGYADRLIPMAEETAQATELDRTRQYRRVGFYRINK